MADQRSLRGSSLHGFTAVALPHVRLAALAVLAAAPLLLIAVLVPRAVFLPSVSLAAIAAAAAAAFFARWFGVRRHRDAVTLWDIAGACALIGSAAAMLSEPESILQAFGHR